MIVLLNPATWKKAALPALAGLALAGCVSSGPPPVIPDRTLPRPVANLPATPDGSGAIIVRPGDSLYAIARDQGVALRGLIDTNRLRAPYVIRPGQRLVLPRARYHVVDGEETIYGIARRYDVDMGALVRVNDIAPPYKISRNQRLRLPDRPRSARTAAAPAPRRVRRAPQAVARPAPPPDIAAVGRPPRRAGTRFLWPLRGKLILRFGRRDSGLHNDGINIAARAGSIIRAAENGVVAYAGNQLQGFGNLILLKHADGWTSAYAHASKMLVRRGQMVRRGQAIARVGRTGNVTRPQLHFELRKGNRAVNPTRYLIRLARTGWGRVFAMRPAPDNGRSGSVDPGL